MPFLITREMEQQLADLGYSKELRKKLTPQEANDIINGQKYYTNENIEQKELKEDPFGTEWKMLHEMWNWAVDRITESSDQKRCSEIMGLTASERSPEPIKEYLNSNYEELTPEEQYFLKISISVKEFAQKMKSKEF